MTFRLWRCFGVKIQKYRKTRTKKGVWYYDVRVVSHCRNVHNKIRTHLRGVTWYTSFSSTPPLISIINLQLDAQKREKQLPGSLDSYWIGFEEAPPLVLAARSNLDCGLLETKHHFLSSSILPPPSPASTLKLVEYTCHRKSCHQCTWIQLIGKDQVNSTDPVCKFGVHNKQMFC